MTQRRPSGRAQHRAGRCVCPQAHSQAAAASGTLHSLELGLESQSGPEALPPPRASTFHPVQDLISLSPGVICPCPSGTTAGPASSSPQPCPAWPQAPCPSPSSACPWEGAWCPGLVASRLPAPGRVSGTEPGCQARQAVSNTTISTIQKGGSCQQPVRQQKHPGTILAEENRKDSWSCCKAPTATSMAFIYFWECPYMHTLLCKGCISLQTAQFLLLAGNFLDISEGLVN